jgi:hypothetical protein
MKTRCEGNLKVIVTSSSKMCSIQKQHDLGAQSYVVIGHINSDGGHVIQSIVYI